MRLLIALTAILLSTAPSLEARAAGAADDIVILSVKPRSADVGPVIVPPPAQPLRGSPRQSAQTRKPARETLPDNRPAEKTRPELVLTDL